MAAVSEVAVSPTSKTARSVRRFVLGIVANLTTQVVQAGGQILLVPLFLSFWGNQTYGEWLTLTAAVTYLSMIDLGMQTYVVNRLTQRYSLGDMAGMTHALHSAFLFAFLVAGTAVAVFIPAVFLLPIERWFDLTETSPGVVSQVSMLLLLYVVLGVPVGLLVGIYRSIGEYARGAQISNVQRLLLVVSTGVGLSMGAGMRTIAALQVISMMVVNVGYILYDLRRRHPEIDLGFRRANLKVAISFLSHSSLFLLIQLSMLLTLQGSTLLAGALEGAALVPVFVTLRTLTNLLKQMSMSISAAAWPEWTRLEAQGQYATLAAVHTLLAKTLVGLTVCGGLFLYYAGADVVEVWTGGRIEFDQGLMTAFLLLLVTQTWWLPSSLLLTSSNRHHRLAWYQIGSAVIGLAFGWQLGQRWGMTGIVYGLLAADLLLCCLPVVFAACRLVRDTFAAFARAVLLRGVPVAAAGFLTMSMADAIEGAGAHIAVTALAAIAMMPLWYLLWLDREDRVNIVRLLPARLRWNA